MLNLLLLADDADPCNSKDLTPSQAIHCHMVNAGQSASYTGASNGATADVTLIALISGIINAALAITGVIVLVFMIYAGYTWMTAGGDSDKVTKAKETISRSVIGLAIVLFSYAIVAYVVPMILCASGHASACPGGAITP